MGTLRKSTCNKQSLDGVFVISRIITVKVRVISQRRRLRLITPLISALADNRAYLDLDYFGYHENRL